MIDLLLYKGADLNRTNMNIVVKDFGGDCEMAEFYREITTM